MHLRRLEAHESDLLRDLRLGALRESPNAFRDTYSDVAAKPSSYWDRLTRLVTAADQDVMFLAFEENKPVGSVFGIVDRVQSRAGRVGGMWVAPMWRRRGIGEALLQEVFDWARGRGFGRLSLWCVVDAAGPVSLYRKLGFQETGNHQSLSAESPLRVAEMERLL